MRRNLRDFQKKKFNNGHFNLRLKNQVLVNV